jgi:uncharacterized membrane protein YedE/YeeE
MMSSTAIHPPKATIVASSRDTVNVPVVLLTIAIIAACFAFYYQSWNASKTLVPAELVPYDVEANKSAESAESGNINAAISFLGLAFAGARLETFLSSYWRFNSFGLSRHWHGRPTYR